jgi:hypothetical protein
MMLTLLRFFNGYRKFYKNKVSIKTLYYTTYGKYNIKKLAFTLIYYGYLYTFFSKLTLYLWQYGGISFTTEQKKNFFRFFVLLLHHFT